MVGEHRPPTALDEAIDPDLRRVLEERFWRPIDEQARLEALRGDPRFLAEPAKHPALFADHGVVHVRDIANGLIDLATLLDGVVLARRTAERQAFVVACGVLVAYVHDVGMVDLTPDGRRLHALVGAHLVHSDAADDVVDAVLRDGGPVARRLAAVDRQAPFDAPIGVVVRELLSLSMAHSKSTVPAWVLDDRVVLRRLVQRAVFTDLHRHRAAGRPPAPDDERPVEFRANHERYADPACSYGWLVAPSGPHAALADDVIDGVRILRAADALRQRGTTLRTSGGHEICLDASTGRAVYTLRTADESAAYLLTVDDDRAAGEANLRAATVTPSGHLRIAFHRGAFGDTQAAARALRAATTVVADIVDDVLPPFDGATWRSGLEPPTAPGGSMRVEIERPGDDPAFAGAVAELVRERCPALADRIGTAADVERAAPDERDRYHRARPLDLAAAARLVAEMGACGAKVAGIDDDAFADVRVGSVAAGDVLVAAGSPPAFVYVPTGSGLTVVPAGGYERRPVRPWVPIGTTGVIRRAERNADIVADRTVDVVMIPAAEYLASWFRPYDGVELAAVLADGGSNTP